MIINYLKKSLLILTILSGLFTVAQDQFYPGSVTYQSGESENIYFKIKTKIFENNAVLIFKTNTHSSKLYLTAEEFSSIESLDGELVYLSRNVQGLENSSRLILKQLVRGKSSLFTTVINNTDRYVIQKDNEFYLLKSSSSQSGFKYQKWLYENLNSRGLAPDDYTRLKHTKDDLKDYVIHENSNAQILNGEKQIDFFNLGVQGGLGLYNYSFATESNNFTLNDASSTNYQIGLRTHFHFDRLQDSFSAFVDVKYSTVSQDGSGGTAFPQSNSLNSPLTHDYNFSMLYLELGMQYNFNFKASTISHLSNLAQHII